MAWVLGVVAVLAWKGPRVRVLPVLPVEAEAYRWSPIVAALLVLAIVLTPLWIEAARLYARGDYASQTYLWRSAPPGIDIASLILGNPAWSQRAYAHFGIDRIESAAWLGLVPMLLVAYAASQSRLRAQGEIQRWLWVLCVFLVWALGPYVMAFGANTGFMLPQTALRFVPMLSNARMPGRAFVMVVLAVAMLAALALASITSRISRTKRRRMLSALAAAIILFDYSPGQQAFTPLDRPALYGTLRRLPPGPVLELPLGIRDGFGEQGHLDHRVLFYQTLHEHPLAGGFVARLSPRVRRAYETDPVFGPLLSDDQRKASVSAGVGRSLACEMRYLVMPSALSSSTREFVDSVCLLEHVSGDDSRDLYRIVGWKGSVCQ
jgi:hypothetical protein